MSNKKEKTNLYVILAFICGVITTLLLINLINYLSYSTTNYPYYYMMPMMRMMTGSLRNVDCSQLSDAQFEKIGEDIMGQMIGNPTLHEQMDEQMKNETAMHILMGRMMTGCQ